MKSGSAGSCNSAMIPQYIYKKCDSPCFVTVSHIDKNPNREFYASECARNDNIFHAWCDVVYLKSIRKKQDEVCVKPLHKSDKQCRRKDAIREMRRIIKFYFLCNIIVQFLFYNI
jgi:hypothetical protein